MLEAIALPRSTALDLFAFVNGQGMVLTGLKRVTEDEYDLPLETLQNLIEHFGQPLTDLLGLTAPA